MFKLFLTGSLLFGFACRSICLGFRSANPRLSLQVAPQANVSQQELQKLYECNWQLQAIQQQSRD